MFFCWSDSNAQTFFRLVLKIINHQPPKLKTRFQLQKHNHHRCPHQGLVHRCVFCAFLTHAVSARIVFLFNSFFLVFRGFFFFKFILLQCFFFRRLKHLKKLSKTTFFFFQICFIVMIFFFVV